MGTKCYAELGSASQRDPQTCLPAGMVNSG